jgi:hypothetical protein
MRCRGRPIAISNIQKVPSRNHRPKFETAASSGAPGYARSRGRETPERSRLHNPISRTLAPMNTGSTRALSNDFRPR